MANNDDATFTFDTKAMQEFFSKMGNGMDSLSKNMKGFGNMVSGGVKKGLLAIGKLGIAFVGIKKLIGQIPEIGQTFKIAGDIAMRNFLWPLRKMLMPMLQGILNWVRDNRAMFVKWGQHLANIFKGVITIIKGVFTAVKSVIDGIMKGVFKAFGGTVKSLDEFMNIMTFKFNALMMFFSMILNEIGKAVGSFFEGFLDTASPVIDIIQELLSYLGDMFGDVNLTTDAFKTLGKIAGAILTAIVGSTVMATMALVQMIGALISGGKATAQWLAGDKEGAQKTWDEQSKSNEKFFKTMEKIGGMIGSSFGKIFEDVNVYVTEGDAEVAGRNFARGAESQFRSGILATMSSQGY